MDFIALVLVAQSVWSGYAALVKVIASIKAGISAARFGSLALIMALVPARQNAGRLQRRAIFATTLIDKFGRRTFGGRWY